MRNRTKQNLSILLILAMLVGMTSGVYATDWQEAAADDASPVETETMQDDTVFLSEEDTGDLTEDTSETQLAADEETPPASDEEEEEPQDGGVELTFAEALLTLTTLQEILDAMTAAPG